tara:strand:- start:186 stop:629 length:444 start_codon:yes stop_codon:yes gene_type:complete
MKNKMIKVVVWNDKECEVQQKTISLTNLSKNIKDLVFMDLFERHPEQKNYMNCVSSVPYPVVNELTSNPYNTVFPIIKGEGDLVMYCDDTGLLRQEKWNSSLYTHQGHLFGNLVLMRIDGYDDEGNLIWGDCELDKVKYEKMIKEGV